MKSIEIKCTGSSLMDYRIIENLQGDLKNLSAENYLKLKKQVLKEGFISPVHVWINEGIAYSLDGVQRLRTLTGLENEGFNIPKIPIVEISAKDIKEAKRKLLSLASQYGEVQGPALLELATEAGFSDVKELNELTRFPEIDFDKLVDEFSKDITDKKPQPPKLCKHCGKEQ